MASTQPPPPKRPHSTPAMRFGRVAALSVAFGVLFVAGEAHAEILHRFFAGSACRAQWTANDPVQRDGTMAYNPSPAGVMVTCPLTRDTWGVEGYDALWVDVFDRSSTDEVSCRVKVCNNSLACWGSAVVGTGDPTTGPARLVLQGNTVPDELPMSIECWIPGNSAGASFITAILTVVWWDL